MRKEACDEQEHLQMQDVHFRWRAVGCRRVHGQTQWFDASLSKDAAARPSVGFNSLAWKIMTSYAGQAFRTDMSLSFFEILTGFTHLLLRGFVIVPHGFAEVFALWVPFLLSALPPAGSCSALATQGVSQVSVVNTQPKSAGEGPNTFD